MTIPRAAAARRPTRIVKLIRHAKSTDAAHGCPALLNGEEAAICATPTFTRILGAPSSIIAGQSGGGRLRLQHCHQHGRRQNLGHRASLLEITPRTQNHSSVYRRRALNTRDCELMVGFRVPLSSKTTANLSVLAGEA